MANQKITELTELTTVADEDLVEVVDDPAGTPVNKKVSAANLRKEMLTLASGDVIQSDAGVGVAFQQDAFASDTMTLTRNASGPSSIVSITPPSTQTSDRDAFNVHRVGIGSPWFRVRFNGECRMDSDLYIRGAANSFGAASYHQFEAKSVQNAAVTGASVTFAALIPAATLVHAVVTKFENIVGPASIDIGDGVDVDRWGAGIVAGAGNTASNIENYTVATPIYATSAIGVTYTANGGNFTSGKITVVVHFSRFGAI